MATAATATITAAAAADTLRAIETRAERAIVQELRLMVQQILGLRTQLVHEDRAHADALLMKLDHQARTQVALPADPSSAPAYLMPTLTLGMSEPSVPTAYRVSFYDREYGDLEDVVTLGSFEAGVQLVRDRLSADGHYLITATWANHQGEMTVSTPRQMVLARIEVTDDRLPQVQPPVLKACSALQAGDTSSIAHLFEHLPEAA
ncbi:MAG: hypothetical protein ABI605_16475 [Rhizobacter sp.]